jgi:glycosyltransferase involved in cell wall biosynthesis
VIQHIAVVVPARDEADHIGANLDAIAVARRTLPASVTSATIVVVDGWGDETAAVARQHLGSSDVLVETGARSVGAARRTGSAAALATSPVAADRTWLASTDADTIVPPDWLERQVAEAQRGTIALAGVVTLREDDAVDPRVRLRFDATYGSAVDDGHHHVHGANFGCRGDAYELVGGWRPVDHSEDHDLWRRLTGVGRVKALGSLTVATSARLVGRAPSGFADDLRALRNLDGQVA